MSIKVSAVLVAKNGGEELAETLDAIAAQTKKPDRLIVVTIGDRYKVTKVLAEKQIQNAIKAESKITFGAALKFATEVAVPFEDGAEWLWFLTEDSAPEPDALQLLTEAMAKSQSIAVAGPKLVNWNDEKLIIELGQGLTTLGSRWRLDSQELDQEQYDHFEDVLGVGPVGMLVWRDLWEELQGFDEALKVYDDGLDFSVRARLAGYRVTVVPEARIRFKQNGVGGPKINRKSGVLRVAHRQALESDLHRRLSYAKSPLWFFLWLGLPLRGVFGMFWALFRGRPATVFGELQAALKVFFGLGSVLRSRELIRKNNRRGFGSIKPLRTDMKTVRTQRMIRKEAILAAQGRSKEELHFISTGGLAITLTMAVLSVALTWWLLGASFVNGGGSAPLSAVKDLWLNTRGEYLESLWSVAGYASARPADPLSFVFAIFGTLTFWNPSFAVVALLLFAVPLATLGGWMWGAKLSEIRAARVLSAVIWGAGPMLLAAMTTGRINSIILAVVLPWALVAISNAHRSWSWVATASLLSALVLATSPILLPAAAILLVVGVLMRPSQAGRILLTGLATAVLFAPLILHAIASGRPFDVFIDPGIAQPYDPATPWQMLLGFPTNGMSGWSEVLVDMRIPIGAFTLVTGFALLPLGVLAVIGLFAGHPRATAFAALTGALGLVTALLSPQLHLTPQANALVQVWPGAGLALYWVAIATLAVYGMKLIPRIGSVISMVAVAGLALVVMPSVINLVLANVDLRANEEQLPAVAVASAQSDALTRTLFVRAVGTDSIKTQIVTGQAQTLDEMRTADANADITPLEFETAKLIAALLSNDDAEIAETLDNSGVRFIVLRNSQNSDGLALQARLQTSFDQQAALVAVGETAKGVLWRVAEPSEATDARADWSYSKMLWWIQVGVLIGLLLLALPTAEVRDRPPKDKKPKNPRAEKSWLAKKLEPLSENSSQDTAEAASVTAAQSREPVLAEGEANPRVGEEHFDEVGLAGAETEEDLFDTKEVILGGNEEKN